MVKVTIYKNPKGMYKGFKTLGHAEFAKRGQDIFCAAVSVLIINTINSIETFTDDKFKTIESEKKGLLEIEFTSDVSEKTKVLIDAMILGLQGIINENGSKYINLNFKEV